MDYDLLIRGGALVDGTGAPAREGDVGIRGGRIAALGRVSGDASETIDASGAVVAPGFVDVHTHYDAQVLWDRMLTISPWHGVTSVVVGNCGFGIAPTRPAHHDLILRTLENVEGMSLAALRAGVGEEWPFETFPEYLEALEQSGTAINVGCLVGHTPVRTYVMGEEAVEREASEDEVAAMRAIVADALRAGALGFATSKAPTHVGYDAKPVPSRLAALDEIRALAGCLADVEGGVLQCTIGSGFFLDEFETLQPRIGSPISWTALLGGMLGPDGHRDVLARCEKLQSEGIRVLPQVTCRPLMVEFQMSSPLPLMPLPEMKPLLAAEGTEAKLAALADPELRAAFRPRGEGSGFGARLRAMHITHHPPERQLEERTLGEVAAQSGAPPTDTLLDLAIASKLETRFRMAVLNTDESVVQELLEHPASMLGLSDAGAHASQLCDAGLPTDLLGRWVREKGVLPLEEAVRMLTSEPAEVFGVAGRGRLAEGLAADVTVFDPDTVGCGPLRRVHDFPAGADRLVADADGIRAVVVNGTLVREDGADRVDPDGPLPGRVLRGPAAGR